MAVQYNGIERSEAFIEHVFETQGPFDGLVGFSQGAVMAAALAAMQKGGAALQGAPALRFVLLFAGARTTFPKHSEAMQASKIAVPSCHVYGEKDQIKKYSADLVPAFENSVVLVHERGHVVPQLEAPQLHALRAFLQSVSSPSRL